MRASSSMARGLSSGLVGFVVLGCHFTDSGTQGGDLDASIAETPPGSDRGKIETISPDGDDGAEGGVEGGMPLPPEVAGCSDGTREGFIDTTVWPGIAGCSGGWSVPGVITDDAQKTACARQAGNTGMRPSGEGCSAIDICTAGWHLCHSGDEVAERSLTNCEGATATGEDLFFAGRLAGSSAGVCTPEKANTNNLYGCGNFGGVADVSCVPLDHQLGFADCAATKVWQCGGADDWQREAAVVIKIGSTLGGVLCCRDLN